MVKPMSNQEKSVLRSKLVLIVDDDDQHCELLQLVLRQETSYLPVVASNGIKALHLVEQCKPQLFILDYKLPVMNGLEVYDRLQAHPALKDVPAVLLTAYHSKEFDLGERRITILEKPFEIDELLRSMKQLIGG